MSWRAYDLKPGMQVWCTSAPGSEREEDDNLKYMWWRVLSVQDAGDHALRISLELADDPSVKIEVVVSDDLGVCVEEDG